MVFILLPPTDTNILVESIFFHICHSLLFVQHLNSKLMSWMLCGGILVLVIHVIMIMYTYDGL